MRRYDLALNEPDKVPEELHLFALEGADLDDDIWKTRIDLLERVYKRPADFWKQIHTAGTVRAEMPTRYVITHNDTICTDWPGAAIVPLVRAP